MLRAAVRAGLGVGLLACFEADVDRELVKVCPAEGTTSDLWLVWHADVRQNARIQAVASFIRTSFNRDAALFRGSPPSP